MSEGPIITADVWEAIADTAEEAENLRVRAMLMMEINHRIDSHGWTQQVASKNLGLTQPRISDLRNGKMDKFSLDALVNIGVLLGVRLQVSATGPSGAEVHPFSN